MTPERTLTGLLLLGSVAGGLLYGAYYQKAALRLAPSDRNTAELRQENTRLTTELDRLRDELAQARSLASGAPFPVPQELIDYVEKDLNLVFLKTPKVRLADDSEFLNSAENDLNLVYGQDGLGEIERVWELLGILPAGQNLQGALMMAETVAARGIFSLSQNEILLTPDFNPDELEDGASLVGLLVRSLLLQNFPDLRWSNLDAWNAWLAVHRGTATNSRGRFFRRKAATLPEEDRKARSLVNRAREDLLLQLPAALQSWVNFPNLDGSRFIGEKYIESREALLNTFRTPPQTTLGIIAPQVGVTARAEAGIGALGLRLMLEAFLDSDLTDQAVLSWRSDRYAFIDDRLRWELTLGSADSAEQLYEAMQVELLPAMQAVQPEREITLTQDRSSLILTNFPRSEE